MPLTARFDRALQLVSWRTTFADLEHVRRRVTWPVSQFPSGVHNDTWLPFERINFMGFVLRISNKNAMSFTAFWEAVFGCAPPDTVYLAQGGQFAASASALRRIPKATYEWMLRALEAGHDELIYYLEVAWYNLLYGMGCVSQPLEGNVDEPLPALAHLGSRRRLSNYYYYYEGLPSPSLSPPPAPLVPPMPPSAPPLPPTPPATPLWGLSATYGTSRRLPPPVQGLPGTSKAFGAPDCSGSRPGCVRHPIIRVVSPDSPVSTVKTLQPSACSGPRSSTGCVHHPVATRPPTEGLAEVDNHVSFSAAATSLPSDTSGFGDRCVMDVNGDGHLDVVYEDGRVYLNDGSLNFVTGPSAAATSSRVNHLYGNIGDLDGDGDLDLLGVPRSPLTYSDSTSIAVWRNDYDGTAPSFAVLTGVSTGITLSDYSTHYVGLCSSIGDLDGDQDLDVVITRQGHLYVFRNDGSMAFTQVYTAEYEVESTSGSIVSLLADLDNDGDLDLLLAGRPNYNQIFRNDMTSNAFSFTRLPIGSTDFNTELSQASDMAVGEYRCRDSKPCLSCRL